MEYRKTTGIIKSKVIHIIPDDVVIIIMLLLIALYINLKSYLLFHILIETYNIIIAFCISIIMFISIKVNKYNRFMIVGTIFFFIGIFDLFHMLASSGIQIFNNEFSLNLYIQFYVIARFMESSCFLLIFLLPEKRSANIAVFFICFIISLLCLTLIFRFSAFPCCYITGLGISRFLIIFQYIMSAIMGLNIVIFILNRDRFQKSVYNYLMLFFITSIISNLLFTYNVNINDIYYVISNVLKYISYYFIYKAIVEAELIRSFSMLDVLNKELENKNLELSLINKRLKFEAKERDYLEEELKISEERYRLLIEFMPYAVFAYNKNSIIFTNIEGKRILKIKNIKEIEDRPINTFILDEYKDIVQERMNLIKKEGDIAPAIEMKIVAIDGTVSELESTVTCFKIKEQVVYIAAMRDITERKHAEELQREIEGKKKLLYDAAEYDKMRTEFLANISHELKTPLNIIFSTVQLIEFNIKNSKLAECDENIGEHIIIMKQNCYRLLRLINNIIDITKMDSGFYELHLKNCNIVSVIEDITMSAINFVKGKNITLLFDTDVEEKIIACDSDKIERVILNLISNAVKFTRPGGNISVVLYHEKESIIISVKDDGIGIPEDKLKKIFERFVQVDMSLTRNNEGSGIGLSIVKSIVDMHKGKISVKSEMGFGSEFIIELPITVLDENNLTYEDDENVRTIRNEEKVKIEFSDISIE